MVRPTHAVVDLDGLTANYVAIGRYLATHEAVATPRIIAVVKANAYGHGSVPVAHALEKAAADGLNTSLILACADIEEGVELRRAGVTAPILVFGALSVSDLEGVFDYCLTPTVSSPFAAETLERAAILRGVRIAVHLKIDTGMNRFGFRFDNLLKTLPQVTASDHIAIESVYTHFATAEQEKEPLFGIQQTRFEKIRSDASNLNIENVCWHAANSAALIRDHSTWYDAVRPGLLLYGVVPPPFETPLGMELRAVMSLRTRVVAVKGMRCGETSGYGARFVANRPMRVAVIPAGYADGMDLRLGGRGSVLIRERRAPIMTVSMDSTMIDVTDISAHPGDDVVVLGEQGDNRIDAREIAASVGTVPHEILCRIGSRIQRTYNRETVNP